MDEKTGPVSPASRNHRNATQGRRKWLGAVIAVLAIAALIWFLFSPDPIKTELAVVTQGPMQVTINNQGIVRAHDKYNVAAPVAAELIRIELHEGDRVRAGQPVAVLQPLPMDLRQKQEAIARLEAARALAREAGLRVQRASTDLQLAISERVRINQLIKDNFVSPQAADKVRSAEAIARAELEAAKSREQAAIADTRAAEAAVVATDKSGSNAKRQLSLAAPVDGYILKVHEKSERTVPAGTPLVTIGDPTKYEIVVDVLSTEAVRIEQGDLMLLEDWGGGETLRAKVRLVEPVAFTKVSALGVEEQRVNVLADPVDPLGPLGDGYRIEARIVIWSAKNVTKVAGSSLFRVGDAWHVFAVENGRAQEREVKVGQRNQDEAQLLSGLEPGASVVRYPDNQITDGARIQASNQAAVR